MLDIFSPSAERKSQKQNPVIIDIREKNSLVPSELSLLHVPYRFEFLEVGDYISGNTLVERKTISDLKGSIINKRIFSQIRNMRHQSFSPLLILELPRFDDLSAKQLNDNSIRGFLLYISRSKSIPFILTNGPSDSAKYLSLLNKNNTKSESSIRPKNKPKSKQDVQEYILEGFPGIGPSNAKKLISELKSLRNIFNSTIEVLERIIGKKAEIFYSILD